MQKKIVIQMKNNSAYINRNLGVLVTLILIFAFSANTTANDRRNKQLVRVLTGIDVLQTNGFKQLKGKKIGLVTNPTGVNKDLVSTIDILFNAPNVELCALFGPEHGVRGNAHAGDKVAGNIDSETGLPIFSLYGKSRIPSNDMLSGIDAIVYDIQDIGCRSFTFISTMANVMEVAARSGVEFIVLDRPNPQGGYRVEGSLVEPGFESFVSRFPIPYIYGLTCGELACFLNDENILSAKCELTVVEMSGWDREMSFEDTGLPWVMPSPHIPTPEAACLYPATGILGELGVINIGVGYTLPFQTIGAKGVDAQLFARRMNEYGIPGIAFRPIYYKPFYGSLKGEEVSGVHIFIADFDRARISEIQFRAMEVLSELYPDLKAFDESKNPGVSKRFSMFDKVCGSDKIRKEFIKRYKWVDIMDLWYGDVEYFIEKSQKYYLY